MKNILIVEDDIDIHNVIKKALEKKEYNVLNSYSGKEALLLELLTAGEYEALKEAVEEVNMI